MIKVSLEKFCLKTLGLFKRVNTEFGIEVSIWQTWRMGPGTHVKTTNEIRDSEWIDVK